MTKELSVVTVVLECNDDKKSPTNSQREKTFKNVIKGVIDKFGKVDIILFPARFYMIDEKIPEEKQEQEEEQLITGVRNKLQELDTDTFVCLGIDIGEKGEPNNKQFAYAINRKKVEAKGRKFALDPDEKEIEKDKPGTYKNLIAKHYNDEEMHKEAGKKVLKERFFMCKGIRFYLAVCYDVFGIQDTKREDIKKIKSFDATILSLVHHFNKSGKGSGSVYFATKGFGGASLKWGCYVFGAAVFFDGGDHTNWPSGFKCIDDKSITSSQDISYKHNELENKATPHSILPTDKSNPETAVCYLYNVEI
jgi:hypothetical protein